MKQRYAPGPGRSPQRPGDAPGRYGKSKATAEAKEKFLVALAQCGSIAGAARAAGRSTRSVHDWKREPAFAERWGEALQTAVATLEREAWRRAVEGVEENQVSAGKVVGTVRRYSDTLLSLLLRAHAPDRYGPKAGLALGIEAQGPVRLRMIIPGADDAEAPAVEGGAARLRFALPPPVPEEGERE